MNSNKKSNDGYSLIPSHDLLKEPTMGVEHPHAHAPTKVEKGRKNDKKKVWICCSDIVVESNEKLKEDEVKGKNLLLSNVGTKLENLEEMEIMSNKTRFLVCFSKVQVIKR
ncbi:unnamed protein product [Sphenostylis stenocarpa]|uniref:Uncharacterized protein n=1 Tax=Sphenostylis stenocarpa TaxID=92480 RepID=A0AA86W4L5_9FABA|nr:unnamed protein product [Sphenostylis stenocarpa]